MKIFTSLLSTALFCMFLWSNAGSSSLTLPRGIETDEQDSQILDKDATGTSVIDTTTETTIYTFSLPANTLGTDNALRLTLFGDFIGITAFNIPTIRLKYGATTVVTLQLSGPNDTDVPSLLELYLVADDATGAQLGMIRHTMDDAILIVRGTSAEDSTGTLTLEVTLQFAGSDDQYNMEFGILELLQ